MSERRRAEIAEKRARLAQLKAAREEREQLARASASSSSSPSLAASRVASPSSAPASDAGRPGAPRSSRSSLAASTAAAATRNDEIDSLLRTVGVGRTVDTTESLSQRTSTAGDQHDAPRLAVEQVATEPTWTAPPSTDAVTADAALPTLTSSSIEIYSIPPKPKVVYNKGIQTSSDLFPASSSAAQAASTSTSGGTSVARETADELRTRIVAELEAERAALDAAIAEERLLAERAAEAERARGLPGAQLATVFASPAFQEFVTSSSRIVQRALSDSYDYLRDYTVTSDEGRDEEEGRRARCRLLGSWRDEGWGRGRSVTGVDWSHKFPELFVASYNKNPMAVNEPDGIAAVWNLHLLERPEFVFHSQ
ncbi:hypothetical protein JCM3770_001566, partial [Rhodotorula araucariae]